MVCDLHLDDRDVFLSMVRNFYSLDAAMHSVDPQHSEATFVTAMEKSPFLRALMIEEEGKLAGYALLSFTYSSRADGLVVLTEEAYLSEACRGTGYSRQFFKFLEQEYPSAKCFRPEAKKQNENVIRSYQRFGYGVLDCLQMVKDAQLMGYFRLSAPPLIEVHQPGEFFLLRIFNCMENELFL